MKKTILEEANDIVFGKIREKEGEYGPFIESMARGARIATELTRKEITTDDFYKCIIALKLSRMAYSHKQDTYLDTIAYIASNFVYKEEEEEKVQIDLKQFKIDFDNIIDNIEKKHQEHLEKAIMGVANERGSKVVWTGMSVEEMDAINKKNASIGSQVVKGLEALTNFKWKGDMIEEATEMDSAKLEMLKNRKEKRKSIPSMDLKQWFWDKKMPFNPADYAGMECIYREQIAIEEEEYYRSVADNEPDTNYTIE